MCNHSQTTMISWQLNGKVFNNVDFLPDPGMNVGIISDPGGGRVYTLTIGGLPEHNEIAIECVATFDNDFTEVASRAIFLLQGLSVIFP